MRSNKELEDQSSDSPKKAKGINRRSFVKSLPSIGAAGLALPYINLPVLEARTREQQQQQQQPLRISKETLHEAKR